MKFIFPALALAATTVLAQNEGPILDAIATIQAQTQQADADVLAWDGGRRGFRTIFFDGKKLLAAINNGTDVANASPDLSFGDAVDIGIATINLIPIVNQTLIDFIAAIPKFNKLYVTPIVLDSLKQQQAASNEFSQAVIAKVPADLQGLAGQITAPLNDDFNVAIANFTAAVASLPKFPHHGRGWTSWGWRWGRGWGWY